MALRTTSSPPCAPSWPQAARHRENVQAPARTGHSAVGGGADEAPEVYKRLPEVLAAHGDSIRVEHTLTLVGVAIAGRDVFDP